MTFNDATLAQIRAADPRTSTWVSANAGSGKTRVLTDRVARLLLHGNDPQKILCLTYTKAAAAEMQNRLFARLGAWAMMPDKRLREALVNLGEPPLSLDAEKLRSARTLFARSLETPGGLKIQTIHSFCDRLLRRFPLEAGVSPLFGVLEDREAKVLRAEVLEDLADGKDVAAVDGLARYIGGGDVDLLLREIAGNREALCRSVTAESFGVNDRITVAGIVKSLFGADEAALLVEAAEAMAAGKKTDQDYAKRFRGMATAQADALLLENLEYIFLYKEKAISGPFSAKIGKIPTSDLATAHPALTERLDDLARGIEEARQQRVGLLAYQRALAISCFGQAFLQEYDRRKAAIGRLDFDDLVAKTAKLLHGSSATRWVLYKLDGGIDHILVDEAQDTSPAQWSIIAQLAKEFTAGEGARNLERTVFAVGDEKQSIYSFQGADPAAFSRMRSIFEKWFLGIGRRVERQSLLYSFRSSSPILRLVDAVFDGPGPNGLVGETKHRPFMAELPGRVDIWPFLTTEASGEDAPWYQPVDTPAPGDPRTVLAQQLADWIAHILSSRQSLPGSDPRRAVNAGDILVLVQSRGPLFQAIIKELKARDLAVAGADRLDVGKELAVRDILSLLRFADLPEDDLSLAEALRSPLIGLSEAELFKLSYERKGTLWQSLRGRKTEFEHARELLWQVLAQTDFLRPFELIEMILVKFSGRERFIARLGTEVEDGIDELLSQALRYEQIEVPTLSGFLHWFDAGKVEIKREMDSQASQIRVMTVHGAKGLEAPIVILPDTAKRPYRDRNQIVKLPDGSAGWKTDKANATEVQLVAQHERKLFEIQERMRLLYVALTRAKQWLVICGAGDAGKDDESWYNLIRQGVEKSGAVDTDVPCVGAARGMEFNWTPTTVDVGKLGAKASEGLPDWAVQPAPTVLNPPRVVSPSGLAGDKALTGEDSATTEEESLRKGRQVHLLLEHLPRVNEKSRRALARNLLRGDTKPASEAEFFSILTETNAVLDNPDFAYLFSGKSFAEVGVTAVVPELDNSRISGAIDRLIVSDSHVLAVDFKTNAVVPDRPEATPAGILAQLGAYASALEQIYPYHDVEVAVLWTASGTLMKLSHDIVIEALRTTSTS